MRFDPFRYAPVSASMAALALGLAACSGAAGESDAATPRAGAAAAPSDDSEAPVATATDDASAERDIASVSNERSVDATASSNGAREMARIPAVFRGTWARTAGACGMRSHDRFSVGGTGVDFFEGGGTATAIRSNGSALAVTYDETNPSVGAGSETVYFASLDDGGAMRVKVGDGESVRYTRCTRQTVSPPAGDGAVANRQAAVVPARFRGTYAPDRRACAYDFDYQPTFQNVDVTAERVMFFENGGPVRDVNVSGEAIAITFLDTYGDQSNTRAIYFRLNGDGTVRYRRSAGEDVRSFVKCG